MLGTSIAIACVLADPVELRWNAPAECPTQDDVRGRVERYIGAASEQDGVQVEAEVTEQDGGAWLLELTTTDASGDVQTRVIEDADCEGLAETAAVLTALAVFSKTEADIAPEPEAASEPEGSSQASNPDPAPETAPKPPSKPPEPPPEVLRRTPSRTPLRYGVRLGGGIGFGWLPLGADLGLAGTVGGRGWSAELEVLFGVPRSVRIERSEAAGADLLGWSVAGRGCGVVPMGPWLALPVCGGVEAGQVRAKSVGLDNGDDAALPWVAGLVSTSLRVAVHPRVALWLMPEMLIGARRPTFHATEKRDEIFVSAVASGRVRAGLELVF